MAACGLTWRAASELATRIDTTGRAAVFAGALADCERVRAAIHAAGRDAMLERSTGPLRAEVVPLSDPGGPPA